MTKAGGDEAVIAVVITGTGPYFSAGADLTAMPTEGDPFEATEQFMTAVIDFEKPLIAVVNGPAIGIGVTLLAHCSLVVATSAATFWTPFTRIALVPEFCSSILFPRILGPSLAGEMLMFSKAITADEALRGGLVSRVCHDGAEAVKYAMEQIRRVSSHAFAVDSMVKFKDLMVDRMELHGVLKREFEQVSGGDGD